MFTHGSRWVIIGSDVSACTTAATARPASPTTSATRAHSWRSGPHLGDRHELVVVGGQPEADLPQRLADRQPGFGQHPKVSHRGRDAAGQLPRRVGAQIVESGSVDGDRPHAVIGGHPRGDRDDILDRGGGTIAQRRGQRVGAQVDRQRCALLGFHLGRPAPAWRRRPPGSRRPRRGSPAPCSGTRPRAVRPAPRGATPDSPIRISSALTPSPSAPSTAALAVASPQPRRTEKLRRPSSRT